VSRKSPRTCYSCLPSFDRKTKSVNVIVETPKGCRNKFKFDEEAGAFILGSVLPAGASFPYDFGYVPGTKAEDGDPLDVLLLMDVPAFPGCIVHSRIIGVIEAEQTEDGETIRNDRLVAVARDAHDYRNLKSIRDMNDNLLEELDHFFVSYNEMRGRNYKTLGNRGPKRAMKLLKMSQRRS